MGAFLSELFYIIVVLGDCCVCNVFEYQMKTTTFFGNLPGGLPHFSSFCQSGMVIIMKHMNAICIFDNDKFAFFFVVGKQLDL